MSTQEPECMALLFEFLHSLIELELPKLPPLYPRIITLALKWIQTDLVCSQAIAVLRTIALNTESEKTHILEPLAKRLPVFFVALDPKESELPTNTEHNKRVCALMQLLRAMVQADSIKMDVLNAIKEDHIQQIFYPLLGMDESPRLRAGPVDTYSPEAINLYVCALALVDQLAKVNMEWVPMYTNLLKQKYV